LFPTSTSTHFLTASEKELLKDFRHFSNNSLYVAVERINVLRPSGNKDILNIVSIHVLIFKVFISESRAGKFNRRISYKIQWNLVNKSTSGQPVLDLIRGNTRRI